MSSSIPGDSSMFNNRENNRINEVNKDKINKRIDKINKRLIKINEEQMKKIEEEKPFVLQELLDYLGI